MKALVCNGPRDVSISEVADARIERPTDVLVKITSTNICGSDLHIYEGRNPLEPGRRPTTRCSPTSGRPAGTAPSSPASRPDLIHDGKASPSWVVSHHLSLDDGPDAYGHFDERDDGWTKVVLHP